MATLLACGAARADMSTEQEAREAAQIARASLREARHALARKHCSPPVSREPTQAGQLPAGYMPPIGVAICAEKEVTVIEARMEAMIASALASDAGIEPDSLHGAQAAWRRYREAHCGVFGPAGEVRGSIAYINMGLCRLEEAFRREAELDGLVEELTAF